MPRVQFVRDFYASPRARDKSYARSYEVFEDEARLAHCDRHGQAELSEQVIIDARGQSWFSRPNRRLMPSQWTLSDETGQVAWDIERVSLAGAFNPLSRELLTLHDLQRDREYRLKTLTASQLDRLFSGIVADLYLFEGDTPRAALYRKSLDTDVAEHKSLRDKLRSFFKPTYWTLSSDGDEQVISPPLFLLMVMLWERLGSAPD